jgi:hypothetical protein
MGLVTKWIDSRGRTDGSHSSRGRSIPSGCKSGRQCGARIWARLRSARWFRYERETRWPCSRRLGVESVRERTVELVWQLRWNRHSIAQCGCSSQFIGTFSVSGGRRSSSGSSSRLVGKSRRIACSSPTTVKPCQQSPGMRMACWVCSPMTNVLTSPFVGESSSRRQCRY